MTETLTLTVMGEQTIQCAGCEKRIGRALRRVAGIQEVGASARTQQIVVRFDRSQVSPAELQARLAQMGYQVAAQGAHT